MDPGLERAEKDEGVPPVDAAVADSCTAPLTTAGVAFSVGVSGTSGILVPPAEASLYFLPVKLESLALLVAITSPYPLIKKFLNQMLKKTCFQKMRKQ